MAIEITQCANGWMVREAIDMNTVRDPRQYMVFETMDSLLAYISEAMGFVPDQRRSIADLVKRHT